MSTHTGDLSSYTPINPNQVYERNNYADTQNQAAQRLSESAYDYPVQSQTQSQSQSQSQSRSRSQTSGPAPVRFPNEPPISGRAHYGDVAPIALDALTPGLPKQPVNGPLEYLDYMDLSVSSNRKMDVAIYKDLTQSIDAFSRTQSNSAFLAIVGDARRTDYTDAAPLIGAYRDYTTAHKNDPNPLERLHTTAAIQTALAVYLLDHGTVINPTKSDDRGRMLAGLNLDLGAHAAGYLFSADKNLYDAQNYLRKNNLPGESELQGSRNFVQTKLVDIFGPHDIPVAVTALKQVYRLNIIEMAHFQVDLGRHVRAMPVRSAGEIKVAAKGCRDLALLDIAIAQYKAESGDGEGANILYKEGVNFLNVAGRLDGGNADLEALRDVSTKTAPMIEDAIKRQYASPCNNPFGVQR